METISEFRREAYLFDLTDLVELALYDYRFSDGSGEGNGPLMEVLDQFGNGLREVMEPHGFTVSFPNRDLKHWLVLSAPRK